MDFPGGPVVKTLPSSAGGGGLIPGWRAKIPHALGPKNQNIKQKQYCNKFNKDFKNGPHQKRKEKKKEIPESALSLSMCGYSEKAVICKAGRELSPGTKFEGTLILDFPASKIVKKKCLLSKSPNLWWFVMAA